MFKQFVYEQMQTVYTNVYRYVNLANMGDFRQHDSLRLLLNFRQTNISKFAQLKLQRKKLINWNSTVNMVNFAS